MPLDPDIPFKALAGMQRVQPYDPLEVQGQIDRNRVYQAKAQQAQQEMQAQQRLQQLAQQYGNDPDELVRRLGSEFPDQAAALNEQIWKGRKEGALAHKAESEYAQHQLDAGLQLLQGATPETYKARADLIRKMEPRLASLLPPEYDEPTITGLIQIGATQKDFLESQAKASALLADGKTRESVATLYAGASTPQQRATADALVQKAGLSALIPLFPDQQSARAYAISPEKQAELSDKAADNARQASQDVISNKFRAQEIGLQAGNLGVRKQELQRQIAKDKQDATTGAEVAKLPAAVAEKVAGVEQSLNVLSDLQKMIDDPKSGMKARIGPTGGYMLDARVNTPGVSVDPSLARFSAQTATLKNATVKAITGAQMSEPEAKRIMAQVPTMYDKPEVWKQKADTTKENLSLLRQRLLQLSGVNVDTAKPTEPSGKRFQILSVK